MTIPIFNLPEVVIRKILKLLDPVTLLEISFMKPSINWMIRRFSPKAVSMALHFRSIFLKFENRQLLVINFGAVDEVDNKEERRLGNSVYRFWRAVPPNIIECIPCDFDVAILEMFRHFREIFKIKNLEINIEASVPFIRYWMENLPRNPKLLKITDRETSEDDVETILEHFDGCEEIEISSEITQYPRAIYRVHALRLHNCLLPMSDVIRLDCEFLLIEATHYTIDDFRLVIDSWMDNNTHFGYFRIHSTNGYPGIRVANILEGLDEMIVRREWDDTILTVKMIANYLIFKPE